MNSIRQTAENFFDQLSASMSVEHADGVNGTFSSVTICGMGGSGVVGDFLNVLYPDKNISVHKSYGLPSSAGRKGYRRPNTLYLFISHSGETEETISSYEEAFSEGLPCAVVAGGGRLLERAKAHTVPHVHIPYTPHIPARFSVGYLLNASLTILSLVGTTDGPRECFAPVSRETVKKNDICSGLSHDLAGKTVLVYTEPTLEALGLFWKEMLNETAKMPAFNNLIPEAHHNEVESIRAINKPFVLVLHDASLTGQMTRQLNAFEALSREEKWGYQRINLTDDHLIGQLMRGVSLAFWTGIFLAEQMGVEPAQTLMIERLKKHSQQ